MTTFMQPCSKGGPVDPTSVMQHDPLLEYRVTKLEEVVAVLADGVSDIASTFRGAKWAVLAIFGVVQPLALYLITKGI